ncbi:MAG: PD40 domain-containing protein [Acidobacteria bacterium]|nr:PD40 domain-containing protein [Acidobacteriota bacterium]
MPGSTSRIVRFGPFEANLFTQELRKHGIRLRLPNQSFVVLSILLERPGELVTRVELCERLWPTDTFVEYDQGLNAAVNRLRDVLGDSAEKPRYIETLPKRGYRFLATIEIAAPTESQDFRRPDPYGNRVLSDAPSNPDQVQAAEFTALHGKTSRTSGELSKFSRNRVRSGAIIAALVLIAIFLIRYLANGNQGGSLRSLRAVPFTSLPGQEVAPSFSPDGSQIAFAWRGDTSNGFDLYVKTIGSERMLRLTYHPSTYLSPAWSPDGTQIAFSRSADQASGIFVVPALGGAERKLASATFWYEPLMQISWAPDGKSLAYWSSDKSISQVFLLPLATLEPRMLTSSLHCWDTGAPAFSPDGKNLAVVCTSSIAVYEIYTIPLSGGPPRSLASRMGYPQGLAWSNDGRKIIFSSDSGNGGELWQVDLEGTLARLPLGEDATEPAVAEREARLAYVHGSKTVNIWRIGLRAPEGSPTRLIFSTHIQRVPQYSPDGTKIIFESNRSGSHEIWIVDADGSNPVQLTSFNGPQTGAPSWCSDGHRIAFDSRVSGKSAIYQEDINERLAHEVKSNVQNLALPTWSEDCKWLLASNGHDALYRLPTQGGAALLATEKPSWYGVVSRGRLFFNVKEEDKIAIWSKPANGGGEEPVRGMPALDASESWMPTSRGIYYTQWGGNPPSLNFYEFASATNTRLLTLSRNRMAGVGLSVSPDERWLIYAQTDDQQSDIMLVDGFR